MTFLLTAAFLPVNVFAQEAAIVHAKADSSFSINNLLESICCKSKLVRH